MVSRQLHHMWFMVQKIAPWQQVLLLVKGLTTYMGLLSLNYGLQVSHVTYNTCN